LVQGDSDRDFERYQLIRHPENPELDRIDPAVVQDDLNELARQTKVVLGYVQSTMMHRTSEEQGTPIMMTCPPGLYHLL